MNIGFVGLGNMGLPMAKNLAAGGHTVMGFDIDEACRAAAGDAGIAMARGVAAAAADGDAVVTMLPNGQIAKQVADEVLSVARAGATLIDCSTIDVDSARAIHAAAKSEQVDCLDAPVSGGIVGAAAGTLTFMVGGEASAFEKGLPILKAMGGKQVHCGAAGAGQAAKICNNMVLAVSMIGVCEAFSLGEKLGLDPQRLFDVMSTSSGSCWSVNTYCPIPGVGPKSPADDDYKPGFATDLMVKDVGLAVAAARRVSAATPLGANASEIYQEMQKQGMGGQDFSAVIRYLKTLDG